MSKRFAGKQGIEDLTIHDFKLVFGVDIQTTMSKGDRMIYGESSMTHAMTFTAVSCDVSVRRLLQALPTGYINTHSMIFISFLIRRTMELPPNSAWRTHGVRIGVKRVTW